MRIGRTCPCHKDLSVLFPKSRDLQKAVCLYFVVVVCLCKDIVSFSKRSFFSQLSYTIVGPFESKFGPYQRELEILADLVRDEVSVASKQIQVYEAKVQALERQEASSFRQLGMLFRDNVSQDLVEAKAFRRSLLTSRLLDACTTFDYRRAWKHARKLGSSHWILHTEEYKTWLSASERSALLLTGKLGAGKTVLSASVVEDLSMIEGSLPVYFFCRFDDSKSLKARTIAGSLTRQILEFEQSKFTDVEFKQSAALDLEELSSLLRLHWPKSLNAIFIIVDGIDECPDAEIREVLLWLNNVYKNREPGALLKIFFTSRQEISRWERRVFINHTSMSMPQANTEIPDYIRMKLEESGQTGSLAVQDPTLISKISDVLETGAQGMFLWVAFQIRTICEQQTDRDILNALDNLPKDLPETFDRILQRLFRSITSNDSIYQKILDILSVTYRPLQLAELREALSVEPGNIDWDPSCLVNDIQKTVDNFGGLLISDEEYLTVHFAHHSIRTYLTTHTSSSVSAAFKKKAVVDQNGATMLLSKICVTYLNLSAFEQQLTKKEQVAKVVAEPFKILEASMNSTGPTSNIALALLKRKMKANSKVELRLNRPVQRQLQHVDDEALGVFKAYVEKYWHLHCELAFDRNPTALGNLKARGSTASLLLRCICRTMRFDLLGLDGRRHYSIFGLLIYLLRIAYDPSCEKPGGLCELEDYSAVALDFLSSTVSAETLREYGLNVSSSCPFRDEGGGYIVMNHRSSPTWGPISLAAALGKHQVVNSFVAYAYKRSPIVRRYDDSWARFTSDYVRAFRESSCRADRETMLELARGAGILFWNLLAPITDDYGCDMLYYATATRNSEICSWLIDSPLQFDLRKLRNESLYQDLLAKKKLTLRAASRLKWMHLNWDVDFFKNTTSNLSTLSPENRREAEGVRVTRDFVTFEDPNQNIFWHGIYNGPVKSLIDADTIDLMLRSLGFQGSLITSGDNQAYGVPDIESITARQKVLREELGNLREWW